MNNKKKFVKFANLSRGFYEGSLNKYGDTPAGVNWSTPETQQLRFEILLNVGNLEGKKVHDVGCGLAHMHDYIEKKKIACDYVGSDISDVMITTAKKRLGKSVELNVANICAKKETWMSADFVLNSGIFTVKGDASETEWWQYIQHISKHMFEICKQGIAFNLMSSHVDYKDNHLFYIDPAKVLSYFVENLSRRVVIRHDYPLWEFTVYVYK